MSIDTNWKQLTAIGTLIVSISSPGCTTYDGSQRDHGLQSPALGHYSQQGENPGTMNFILGSLTATTAAGLLANGSVQLNRGIQLRKHCTDLEFCDGEPLSFKYAAAGTSFALVVPLAIASGFLLRSAIRSYYDHQEWHRRRVHLQTRSLSWQSRTPGPRFLRLSLLPNDRPSKL